MGDTSIFTGVTRALFSILCRRELPMFHKQYLVKLASEDRTSLKTLISSGSPKALPRRRAQIGLLCDQEPESPA